jgi:hypothetical protein
MVTTVEAELVKVINLLVSLTTTQLANGPNSITAIYGIALQLSAAAGSSRRLNWPRCSYGHSAVRVGLNSDRSAALPILPPVAVS